MMNWFKSFFGNETSGTVQNPSPVEVVVFLSSLASKPQEIDPLLEVVRRISSTSVPGAELSEKDQQDLAEVFLKLEQYLIQNEPLRVFNKEQISKKIGSRFRPDSKTNAIFWDRVGSAKN